MWRQCFVLTLFMILSFSKCATALDERDRVAAYHERNYTWPPDDFQPDTPGWRRLMMRRFEQVERVVDRGDKYNGWVSTVHTAITCPNFTESGWGLTRAPQDLVDDLVKSLHNGLESNPSIEGGDTQCIESENRPLFISQNEINSRALRELLPIHEAWAGVKLKGNNAYGLRVYRNNSNLNMHIDKRETHIISSILHVDHDPGSEPWPIVIEDYQGNTNEVVLESGDMLLYESSKCFHGRPRKFNGLWYSSLFIHYYPSDWLSDRYSPITTHYRIPPDWDVVKPPKEGLEELDVIDTSVKEPGCKDTWCALEDTIKWKGPAEAVGKVLSSGGVVTELQLDRKDEL